MYDGKRGVAEKIVYNAIDKIKTNSRRYAKRQLTWFKSNKKVNWYSYDYDLKVILNMIKSFQSIQQST